MKKTAVVLLILFLAGIIGYGGGGVNYINYCCQECEAEGVDAVVNDLCCETHGHDHIDFVNENGQVFHHDGDCLCCGLKRVNFEWTDDNVYVPLVHLFSFELPWIESGLVYLQSLYSPLFLFSVDYTGPPITSPRIYLSLLTTLLI